MYNILDYLLLSYQLVVSAFPGHGWRLALERAICALRLYAY